MDLKKLAQALLISVVIVGILLSVICGMIIGIDFLINRYSLLGSGVILASVVIVILTLCVYSIMLDDKGAEDTRILECSDLTPDENQGIAQCDQGKEMKGQM